MNNFTAAFGSSAVAAMGIVHKLAMIPIQVALGLSQGVMPLVSYNYASKNIERMKKAFVFTSVISVSFLVFTAAMFYFFAPVWIELFMKDSQIIAYGVPFLKGACLAEPFIGLDFMGVAVFQATGIGILSLIFALLRKVVLEIPALFILNRLFPLYGLAYAQVVSEVVLAIAAVIVLSYLFKKWEKEGQQ